MKNTTEMITMACTQTGHSFHVQRSALSRNLSSPELSTYPHVQNHPLFRGFGFDPVSATRDVSDLSDQVFSGVPDVRSPLSEDEGVSDSEVAIVDAELGRLPSRLDLDEVFTAELQFVIGRPA